MVAWVQQLLLKIYNNKKKTCLFASITLAVKGSTWTGLYNSVTGENMSLEELLKYSERVSNLERLFNIREGFD